MGHSASDGLTWHVALRLGRVSNLPTVWTNVLAGAVLSGAALDHVPFGLLVLAISLFYIAGMYLNDAFDAKYDRLFRPSRPIPAGAVTSATVFAIGAGLLMMGLAVVLAAGSTGMRPGDTRGAVLGFLTGLSLAALIILYDAWHKGNPIGPVLMGLCRSLVYLTVGATLAGSLPADLLWAAAMILSYVIGLTYAAKQEDLVHPGNLWPLLFLAAPLAYGVPIALRSGAGAILLLSLLAVVVSACTLIVRRGRAGIARAIPLMIAGICLLDGVLIAGQDRPALALLTIAGFGLTLLAQKLVPGT